jgi:molecular chaperone DnaK
MVKDAEAHAEEDKKRRELVEAKNQADGLIHTAERSLTEAGDKVPAEEKTAVEQAVQALKDVVGGEDLDAIKSKTEALAQASMKIGEALYRAQQAAGDPAAAAAGADQHPGAGPHGGGAHDDKVVDADFEEVDEQKKRGSG